MLVDCILIFVCVFIVVVFILSVRAKWLVDKVCSFFYQWRNWLGRLCPKWLRV